MRDVGTVEYSKNVQIASHSLQTIETRGLLFKNSLELGI